MSNEHSTRLVKRMVTKVIIIALLVSSLLNSNQFLFAQAVNQSAREFDEFGDLEYESAIARMDNVAIELQNNPQFRAYIITYRGRNNLPGVSLRYSRRLKNYLVRNRGIDANRVVTVDGGIREEVSVEIWLVPTGTTPPSPTPTLPTEPINPRATRKFDEVSYYIPAEDADTHWSGYVEDQAAQLDGFAEALRREPNSRGYMIAYALYYVSDQPFYDPSRGYYRTLLDPPTLIPRMLRRDRNYLSRVHGIDASRIIIINGGYRRERTLELWIVPDGASRPRPTPNAFPRRRRRR
jgi:hypothetical protein